MAAPVMIAGVEVNEAGVEIGQYGVNESVVWDVYRALCGALIRSDRTEVWTLLTNPGLRLAKPADPAEDQLFQASLHLVCALRAEAAGESPSDHLASAHALLTEAIGVSAVRNW